MNEKVVNTYDEWTPLEEVIVGTPYHLDYHDDTSFRLFFHENLSEENNRGVFARQPSRQLMEEALEDLEGFIDILKTHDVVVRRPDVLEEVPTTQTPGWSAPAGHAMMPRDPFLVIGDEIIETPPTVRARFFEGDLYKELFTEYFNAGARWTVAPRSRLLDRNFDFSFVLQQGYDQPVPEDPFYEIMFDGAQVMRLGRDLILNASTENHRMGAAWLARHLGDEFRVHTVAVADNHIDGKVLPLRPGTLLVRETVDISLLPPELQTWDIIWYEWFDQPVEIQEDGIPFLASQSIGINVLSLDEDVVVVQDMQLPLIRSLEKAGFTPVPCQWRHGRSLGGGFHCVTLDVRRSGGLEQYL